MKISVVVATFNRGPLLLSLLRDLAQQEDPGPFDVVIVDDGSAQPTRPLVEAERWPFPVQVATQSNAGQARARHRGILSCDGEIVVIVDDDMRLPRHFLAAHRAHHVQGADVVLGHIRPSQELASMPLFERFHARQLDLFVAGARAGKRIPGTALCTGNVSFRRERYMAIGGFDLSLQRSEDREIGIRLEKAGARFVFSEQAYTTHASDHTDRSVWMRRAFLYGVYDLRISRKHPQDPRDDPWHYMLLVNPISRPLLLSAVAAPAWGEALASTAVRTAELCDQLGFEKVAIHGATLVFGLQYFRGVRAEYASALSALRAFVRHLGAVRQVGAGAQNV